MGQAVSTPYASPRRLAGAATSGLLVQKVTARSVAPEVSREDHQAGGYLDRVRCGNVEARGTTAERARSAVTGDLDRLSHADLVTRPMKGPTAVTPDQQQARYDHILIARLRHPG